MQPKSFLGWQTGSCLRIAIPLILNSLVPFSFSPISPLFQLNPQPLSDTLQLETLPQIIYLSHLNP